MEVDKGSAKHQISSPIEWLRMRVWKMSLRRTKSTIISYLNLYYKSYILPIFDYGCLIWGCCSTSNANMLIRSARIILNVDIMTPFEQMFSELNWLPFSKRVNYHRPTVLNNMAPVYFTVFSKHRADPWKSSWGLGTEFLAITCTKITKHPIVQNCCQGVPSKWINCAFLPLVPLITNS